jgi:mandelate racemase
MQLAPLTFKSIRARAVVLKLRRPVVARIATITDWPLILLDLITEEGIVGRSYLEPYTIKTMRYLIPALQDFGAMLRGRRVAPVELYDLARKSLHFVGYQGLSMIAVSGLDMAAENAREIGWFLNRISPAAFRAKHRAVPSRRIGSGRRERQAPI